MQNLMFLNTLNLRIKCPMESRRKYNYNTVFKRFLASLKDYLKNKEIVDPNIVDSPKVYSSHIGQKTLNEKLEKTTFSFLNLPLVGTYYNKFDDTVKNIRKMGFSAVENHRMIKGLVNFFGDKFNVIHMLSLYYEKINPQFQPLMIINAVEYLTAFLSEITPIKELDELSESLLLNMMIHLNKNITPDFRDSPKVYEIIRIQQEKKKITIEELTNNVKIIQKKFDSIFYKINTLEGTPLDLRCLFSFSNESKIRLLKSAITKNLEFEETRILIEHFCIFLREHGFSLIGHGKHLIQCFSENDITFDLNKKKLMEYYTLKVSDYLCKGFDKNIHDITYAYLTDYYQSILENKPTKSCTDSVISLIIDKDLGLGQISLKMFICIFRLNRALISNVCNGIEGSVTRWIINQERYKIIRQYMELTNPRIKEHFYYQKLTHIGSIIERVGVSDTIKILVVESLIEKFTTKNLIDLLVQFYAKISQDDNRLVISNACFAVSKALVKELLTNNRNWPNVTPEEEQRLEYLLFKKIKKHIMQKLYKEKQITIKSDNLINRDLQQIRDKILKDQEDRDMVELSELSKSFEKIKETITNTIFTFKKFDGKIFNLQIFHNIPFDIEQDIIRHSHDNDEIQTLRLKFNIMLVQANKFCIEHSISVFNYISIIVFGLFPNIAEKDRLDMASDFLAEVMFQNENRNPQQENNQAIKKVIEYELYLRKSIIITSHYAIEYSLKEAIKEAVKRELCLEKPIDDNTIMPILTRDLKKECLSEECTIALTIYQLQVINNLYNNICNTLQYDFSEDHIKSLD